MAASDVRVSRPDVPPITILGAGYVGRALQAGFPAAIASRRNPVAGDGLLRFDLVDSSTWRTPQLAGRQVVITFPAEPLEAVQRFFGAQLHAAAGLIVLGSTSAYRLPDRSGPSVVDVDENSPLDFSRPRVAAEEWLRERGATLLQLAGIFGPGRDPASWILHGRVRDGAKLVNLIHVDDIVAVIARLLVSPCPGERFNVANDEPIAWRDLAARLVPGHALPESMAGEYGKRVLIGRLEALMPEHRFRRP
jgi:nucleoside-diphosphate-sugar epimerase